MRNPFRGWLMGASAATALAGTLGVLGCNGNSGTAVPIESVAETSTPAGFFLDRTADTGIQHTHHNGQETGHYAILESLGGGVALIDYDRDGLLDIFVTGGGYYSGPDNKEIKGHPCKLYKNLGNWKFKEVTAEVGLDQPLFYTHGCAVADYDNDGWPDLLVTGWGRLALYHNVPDGKGGRRFEEVSQKAGLKDALWSTSAAWADFDGDGYPDLYVCHYADWSFANNPFCKDYQGGSRQDVCPPKQFTALPHLLYLNNRDGTFRDASNEAGLRMPRKESDYEKLTHLSPAAKQRLRDADRDKLYGKGLGVVVGDVNDDGKPDIYVANDTVDNFLYLNRGQGRFEEVGLEAAVARDDNGSPNGSMGCDMGDYDGSGHLSIFVTNYQHEQHALYRNLGNAQFVFASRSAGISAIGLVYVGFGTGFIDYDNDGAEDLYITNGHVVRYPPPPGTLQQRPVLLHNLRQPGDKPTKVRFANVTDQGGSFFESKHIGRGVAFGDLDNDGRVDLVVSHLNEPVVVLQNAVKNGNHWLGIELTGKPYADAVGAKLTLEVGNQKLVRTIKGGGSYLSASDKRVVFGLGGNQEVGALTVRWPSGKVQTWKNLPTDRYWRLIEGQNQPEAARNPQVVER